MKEIEIGNGVENRICETKQGFYNRRTQKKERRKRIGWSSKTCNLLKIGHLLEKGHLSEMAEWCESSWIGLLKTLILHACYEKLWSLRTLIVHSWYGKKMKSLVFYCIFSFLTIWNLITFSFLRRLTSMTTTRARWKLGMDLPCFYSGI